MATWRIMKVNGTKEFMPEALSALLEAAVAGCWGSGAGSSLRGSLALLREGWTEQAIQRLAALVQREEVSAAYLMLSAGYMLADEVDCALTILDLLRLNDPGYAEAEVLQGLFRRRLGRCATAVKYRPAIQDADGVLCEPAA